ncbi:signal recognition particle protein [Candidatus Woesearchaeota archaeon]|jgi:signal recognition particle subunit SRP54|nr:MAG: signal recognition particle protein [Candidatus Woesearchaeota archaeon]
MVLEKLGGTLRDSISKITKAVFVDERLVNELVKDIQRALLQSDVNVQMVFDLSKNIKERILKDETPKGLSKKEYLIKIVYEELVKFLGEEPKQIELKKQPTKIMLVGLFGNGKTTTAGKLAKYYQKRGIKVCLCSTDTWRPAAFEQLKQLGSQIGVPVFGNPQAKHPTEILKEFDKEFQKYDLVIIDTAGRDALNDELVEELRAINKAAQADETILVMAADVGQGAREQAQVFHDECSVTGVIITKMDGTAKGGGAIAACAVTGAKVMFIGVGEKIDALEPFNPQRFVGRLLGMGDLETLLEKAREVINEEEAQDMSKKLLKGEFNLLDLYQQMEAMSKMGPLGKVLEMIPGLGQVKLPKEAIKVQEKKLRIWRVIMDSCTKEELEEPEKISGTRIERIAKGSGRSASEVRELLKQYKQSKKMVKLLKGKSGGTMKGMEKMMQRMGGGMNF